MTYTLTICIGLWLGLCGQIRTIDMPTLEACNAEREIIITRFNSVSFATCGPKQETK